jgi:hypothetical protein
MWSVVQNQGTRWSLFGDRILRSIYRPEKGEARGSWREFHNWELIKQIKSMEMKYMGHEVFMRKREMHMSFKI